MKDITITSLDTITAFGVTSGEYLFTLDELQNASIEQSEEKTDITGKAGRKLSTLKRNKAVTISGANGLVSGGLMGLQAGSDFETKTTTVMWTDYLTVSGNAALTSYTAIGTVGSEITGLYIKNTDGSLGTKLDQVANSPSSTQFTYTPGSKTLTFNGMANDTEVVVYYQRNITADVLANQSDHYSKKCSLYIDATGEDKCANIYHVQIYIPKADFSGNFTIEMGDNQTVHNFDAEALAGACGIGDSLWTYTVFGENTSDTPALKSISVTTAPSDTSYTAGETFNPAGMVVTATYANNTTKALGSGAYTYSPNVVLATTDTRVVISYTEGGITKTTTQAITVTAG